MNFQMTEDQRAIVDMAQGMFADFCGDDQIQRFWAGSEAMDAGLWRSLCETGLQALILPESEGGSGLGMTELGAVLEVQGKHLAPVPLWTSQLTAATLAAFGAAALRQQWLPAVASGEKLATLSLTGLLASRGLGLSARKTAGGWKLCGHAVAVPLAAQAAVALLPARVDAGVALFAVDLANPALGKTPGMLTHRQPAADLSFDGVEVAADSRLADEALSWLAPRAVACLGALQLGVAAEALRRTVAYTSERIQFDRPIATFQAISQKAADCLIDIEALRSTLWQLLWRLDEGLDATGAAAAVAAWACDTGHRVTHACQHMHGGMGADISYPIHRFTLWSRANEISTGGLCANLDSAGRWLADAIVEL